MIFRCRYFELFFLLLIVLVFSPACPRRDVQGDGFPFVGGLPLEDVPEAELPDLADAIAHLSMGTIRLDADREAFVDGFWRWIGSEAGLPEQIIRNIAVAALEGPTFIMELLAVLQQDYYTFLLVDKQHALPIDYSPPDLVPLTLGRSFRITRDDLLLRRSAEASLEEMAAAAAAEGVVLTAASAYRSGARQAEIFAWQVRTFGLEMAERQSARPGHSQHQLGTALDFFPIDDAFGDTPASSWLIANASRFGWSMSYPDGYEEITGYRFEPWHYRYVGRDLAAFIDRYFEGIQQFALQFIQTWLAQAEG